MKKVQPSSSHKCIPDFIDRFNACLYDPISRLADNLHGVGFTDDDVAAMLAQHPELPEAPAVRLRNYMRDFDRKQKEQL